jgi:hypothetical protein
LESRRPPPAGYRWVLGEGQRVNGGWYFNYSYEITEPREAGGGIGGAPGFLVRDNGVAVTVGWGEYTSLMRGGTTPEPGT